LDRFIKIAYWLKSIIAPSNQDLKIVALCFLGAAIIWVLSALNKTYTSVIKCPVTLEYDPEETILVKPPPEFVEANVTGVGWDLLKQSISFNNQPLRITVDNPVETKQISGYTIQPLLSQHIGSLNLNFIVTDSITFNIQPLKQRRMHLKVEQESISLENSYEIIGPIQLIPDTALLTGPKNMVDTLSDTLRLEVPFDELDEDVNEAIPVNPFDKNLVSLNPSEVQIQFDVSRMISLNQLFPVELINFPSDSSVLIEPAQVVLNFKIQEEFMGIFPETDFLIAADYANASEQDSTVAIEIIETPFYVKDASLDTSQVKLIYAK
jgi:hypothetical protein